MHGVLELVLEVGDLRGEAATGSQIGFLEVREWRR